MVLREGGTMNAGEQWRSSNGYTQAGRTGWRTENAAGDVKDE